MKFTSSNIHIQYNSNRELEIILTTKEHLEQEIEKLKEIVLNKKQLTCEIKQFRQKRSLDANAYLWVLLNEMAIVLRTTKDELYLQVLERYGVFSHIVVKPNVVDKVRQEWRTIRVLGEVTINGQVGIQLQCFFGSSTYDQKEFSTLLDGVVEEAKELGINTMTPGQLALMKTEWGKKL